MMLSVLFNISDKSLQVPELSKRVMVIKPEVVKQDLIEMQLLHP